MPKTLHRGGRLPNSLPIRPRCKVDPVDLGSWVDHDDVAAPGSDHHATAPPMEDVDRYTCAWNGHVPHTGRRPPSKGIGNFRGSTVDAAGREIVLESTLEYAAANLALADRRVKKLLPQVGRVHYSDADGEARHTTFDFVAASHGGSTLAIAIKPKRRLASSGIEETVAAIREQHPDFSDEVVVWTENELPRFAEHNAALVLRSRKLRNGDDVARLKDVVSRLHGTVDLRQLVRCSPLGHARTLTAIVNLIDEGALVPATSKRIGPTLPVRLAA